MLCGSNLEEAKMFTIASQNLRGLNKDGLLKRVQRQLPLEYSSVLADQYRAIREDRGMDASPGEILTAILTDQQFRKAAPYEEERRIWDSVPNAYLG